MIPYKRKSGIWDSKPNKFDRHRNQRKGMKTKKVAQRRRQEKHRRQVNRGRR